jgi:hypothetical protein
MANFWLLPSLKIRGLWIVRAIFEMSKCCIPVSARCFSSRSILGTWLNRPWQPDKNIISGMLSRIRVRRLDEYKGEWLWTELIPSPVIFHKRVITCVVRFFISIAIREDIGTIHNAQLSYELMCSRRSVPTNGKGHNMPGVVEGRAVWWKPTELLGGMQLGMRQIADLFRWR